jgi:polyisoprenoid-binding protein YceI
MVSEGTYRLGPPSGRLTVRTGRTGIGGRAGHDLVIEAESWHATVTVGPGGVVDTSVVVEVDVDSLVVREGIGGIKPMSAWDRSEIQKNMAKVLQPRKFPKITFRSEGVTGSPGQLQIRGSLTLNGVARPITVSGSVAEDGAVAARAVVTQSR